jgi:hypothetical protein
VQVKENANELVGIFFFIVSDFITFLTQFWCLVPALMRVGFDQGALSFFYKIRKYKIFY